jgi:hypothetical protein
MHPERIHSNRRPALQWASRCLVLLGAAFHPAWGVSAVPSKDGQHAVSAKDEASKRIRERVRAGELHVCVTDALTDADSQPVITFHNHCARQVNVMLCVHVPGHVPVYYLILLDSVAQVPHRLWITEGRAFGYRYNACDRPYCTPPRSEC